MYSMVTVSPLDGDGPLPSLRICLETPMIAFVCEKLRVFVNVERVVVAKRGRVRAMEVNILKEGVENGGVSEFQR